MAGAALAAVVGLSLAGCGNTVQGTPWPEGQGPTVPAVAPGAAPAETGPSAGAQGPPTSFTVPGPLSPLGSPVPSRPPVATVPPSAAPRPTSGAPGGTGGSSAEPTRTIAPVPVDPLSGGSGGSAEVRQRPAPGRVTTAPPARTDAPAGSLVAHPSAPPSAPPPLTSDVLADECLIAAGPLAGLLGTAPATPAANAEVRRPDGSTARSCFAVGGSAMVSVNAYTTNTTTPTGHLRTAVGARPLDGTGDGTAAVLVETAGGPTMQLATPRWLVTVAVAGHTPTDEQWRAAATSATAALPAR